MQPKLKDFGRRSQSWAGLDTQTCPSAASSPDNQPRLPGREMSRYKAETRSSCQAGKLEGQAQGSANNRRARRPDAHAPHQVHKRHSLTVRCNMRHFLVRLWPGAEKQSLTLQSISWLFCLLLVSTLHYVDSPRWHGSGARLSVAGLRARLPLHCSAPAGPEPTLRCLRCPAQRDPRLRPARRGRAVLSWQWNKMRKIFPWISKLLNGPEVPLPIY